MNCTDPRLPLTVGQMIGILSFEENNAYLIKILGDEYATSFQTMLRQLAYGFYDQGERHQGLVKEEEKG